MPRKSALRAIGAAICGIVLAVAMTALVVPGIRARALKGVRPKVGVAERVAIIGPAARERLRPVFLQAGVEYPPRRVVLAGFKAERRLEVYAAGNDAVLRRVGTYPILAASGRAGPKLREGDRQVPEGVYAIESLNPNSLYHVALRIGYPSVEDRERAREDGRVELGGDIMIHGGSASIGCLAMGDAAAEELFVLAADTGVEHVEVWLCPMDFRDPSAAVPVEGLPGWMAARYGDLRLRLTSLHER